MPPPHRCLGISLLACSLLFGGAEAAAEDNSPRSFLGTATDDSRARTIPYRILYPAGKADAFSLILVSHGGAGNRNGHLRFDHLGETFARAGFVSLHINHRPSEGRGRPVQDRPADAIFLLDQIETGALPLPETLAGRISVARVGVIGHSFGAYTAHALAGAKFTHGTFRDDRVACIVALSPQGEGVMGAFDRGPDDNSWHSVSVPAFCMVGGAELNMVAPGRSMGEGWRARPFERYPDDRGKYLAILEGQSHAQMGVRGNPATQRFIAQNARAFFEAHLLGRTEREQDIGTLDPPPGLHFVRKGSASPEE